jgi:four helix bundle protein
MMQITELEVWKAAIALAKRSYEITRKFPENEELGLTTLIKRTVANIPACVSSAASRKYGKESLVHLFNARDLLYEVESHYYLAEKLSYITEEELNELLELNVASKRLLFGFIKYYKRNNSGNDGNRRVRRMKDSTTHGIPEDDELGEINDIDEDQDDF